MMLGLLKVLGCLTILMRISHEMTRHEHVLALLVHLPLWGVGHHRWHG